MKKKYELTKKTVIDQWGKNYPKVTTWLAKLQKKNQAAWFLWLYCKAVNKSPNELLALKDDPRSREAEFLLDNFVAAETPDIPNSIKVNIVVSVRSLYKHNYCELASSSGAITSIKQKPYRKHTKEELLKIYRTAQNPRDRALVTFTFSSAIAEESLTNIRWKHLENDWLKQDIPHISLPDILIKGHGVGKYRGVEQHTFLTPEAKKDLIDYKNWLERVKGIKLTPEDYIFMEIHSPFKQIAMSSISKIYVRLSERSSVPFSWHDARRYVETALEEVKIHPNWARKIRGRKVKGEEAPYSRPAVEQLRKAYMEAVPLLEFTVERAQVPKEVLERIATLEAEREQIRRQYKYRGAENVKESMKKKDCEDSEHCEEFKQIPENEILSYLQKGWTIIKELKSGEVIVRR